MVLSKLTESPANEVQAVQTIGVANENDKVVKPFSTIEDDAPQTQQVTAQSGGEVAPAVSASEQA